MLVIVCEELPEAIFQDLLAIQAGLTQPLSDLDENLLVKSISFARSRPASGLYFD